MRLSIVRRPQPLVVRGRRRHHWLNVDSLCLHSTWQFNQVGSRQNLRTCNLHPLLPYLDQLPLPPFLHFLCIKRKMRLLFAETTSFPRERGSYRNWRLPFSKGNGRLNKIERGRTMTTGLSSLEQDIHHSNSPAQCHTHNHLHLHPLGRKYSILSRGTTI